MTVVLAASLAFVSYPVALVLLLCLSEPRHEANARFVGHFRLAVDGLAVNTEDRDGARDADSDPAIFRSHPRAATDRLVPRARTTARAAAGSPARKSADPGRPAHGAASSCANLYRQDRERPWQLCLESLERPFVSTRRPAKSQAVWREQGH